LSDIVVGLVASGTFAGYLCGLLLTGPLAAWKGSRAPTSVGSACGVVGCLTVATATSPGLVAGGAILAGTAAGWVWAPYSDIVQRVAPVHRRARLLAVINTGTSAGFAMLALLAVLSAFASWRVVWFGTAAAAFAAAGLNLAFVPRLRARPVRGRAGIAAVRAASMRRPLVYSVVYNAACTGFFTYATQAIHDGGLAPAVGALLFVTVSATGVSAVWTDRMVTRLGTPQVGALCIAAMGVAMALLGGAAGSTSVVVAAALVYGAGYMVGGAVLTIWTAEALPHAPMAGLTAALVVGAGGAIAAPALIGMLTPAFGLAALLVGAGAAALAASTALWVTAPQEHPSPALRMAPAGHGTGSAMTNPIYEPFEGADEADRVEQAQELDGGGTVTDGPAVSLDQATEADALEQGAVLDTDDEYLR
jgi:predicted MFS family arabinose efflux permease